MEPSPDTRTRVVMVDDHRMFAESLTRLLQLEADFEVLDPCADGSSALALIETSTPHLVVMDYHLPDTDGVHLTHQLLARHPELKVIMLTGSPDEVVMLRAIEAGVSGFLTKDRAATELTESLRQVARGEVLIAPEQLTRVLARLPHATAPLHSTLSERELEVLRLMSEGLSSRAMAERLFLSINTVRNYSQAVLTKLGAHSKLEAVALAVKSGIINVPGV